MFFSVLVFSLMMRPERESPGTLMGGKLTGQVKLVADTTMIPGTPEVIERRKYAPDGCLTERVIATGGELPHIFLSACDGYGNRIEEREYIHHDNTPIGITTCRYDDQERLVEVQRRNSNGDITLSHTYTYGGSGQKTGEKSMDGSKILSQHFYTIDRAGYLEQDSSVEGDVTATRIFKRDANGRIQDYTLNECRKGRCEKIKELSKRNAKGNETELIHTETDTTQNFKNIVVYQDTLPVEIRQYKSKGLNFLRTTQYDKQGHILETTYRSYLDDRPLYEKYSYKWNEHGDKTEEIGYNADGTVAYKLTFEYIYDSVGNMIRKIRIKNGVPVVITSRRIEYY